MATSRQIEDAGYTPRPAMAQDTVRTADPLLSLHYPSAAVEAAERADARHMVRRLANRHGCSGPDCSAPEHTTDVDAALLALDILGLSGGTA